MVSSMFVCRFEHEDTGRRAGVTGITGCPAPGRLKRTPLGSDQICMSGIEPPRVNAGPTPDELTIWPVDGGRCGLDATFQGASGYERAEQHGRELRRRGLRYTFRQEMGGGWTLRLGPLRAADVAVALSALVS
jgi:hypothetical protein